MVPVIQVRPAGTPRVSQVAVVFAGHAQRPQPTSPEPQRVLSAGDTEEHWEWHFTTMKPSSEEKNTNLYGQ